MNFHCGSRGFPIRKLEAVSAECTMLLFACPSRSGTQAAEGLGQPVRDLVHVN